MFNLLNWQFTVNNSDFHVLILLWQILSSEQLTLKGKFKEWASSNWNLLDGLAAVLFFVGFALKLQQPTRGAGHLVYCFDATLWIMRLLSFFSISKRMGPIVVMIYRMVRHNY